jgi:hypothetical protein
LLARVAQRRANSVTVRPADKRIDAKVLSAHLASLGADGAIARRLDAAVDTEMATLVSLSPLTAGLAATYLERLTRPIPNLRPADGALIIGRSYLAHVLLERDPGAYGAADVPVLGTLPPLRKGSPPGDLLTRVIRVTRRGFEVICAVTPATWDGFVWCLARRVHRTTSRADERETGLLATEVVDGLARTGWVFRQVDLHYGLDYERRAPR